MIVLAQPAWADCSDATDGDGMRVLACSGSLAAAGLGLDDRPTSLSLGADGSISGDLAFGDEDDRLTNDGVVDGSIGMGAGNDSIRNRGTINGNIDLGDNPEFTILNPGSSFRNEDGGVVNGDIVGGDGYKYVVLGGTLNGNLRLGDSRDWVTLTGIVNGDITGGGGNDMIEIVGRPTISGRVDAEGGDGDELIFSGDSGSWDSGQFGGFEKLRVSSGATVQLTSTWNFRQIDLWGGTLIVDDGFDDGLGGPIEISDTSTYILNGVHYGDIVNHGLLSGRGRISNMAIEAAHLYNHGVVSPGGDGIGTFTVADDFHQSGTGRLDIHVGAPGQSDLLAVGGTAYLDGTVNFIPLDLAQTGAYTFMTYGAVNGQFASITSGSGTPGLFYSFDVDYLSDRAIVNIQRTGSETPPPAESQGCQPSSPASGATVICLPSISQEQIFTADDLTIKVDGLLELETADAVLESRGDNGLISVAADAGIVNSMQNGVAIAMSGDSNRLDNAGILVVEGLEAGSDGAVVELSSTAGNSGRVHNLSTGVIGDSRETMPGMAIHARTGGLHVENEGRIYGAIYATQGEPVVVVNGTSGGTGPALIRGPIITGEGADSITNHGTIEGWIRTYEGDDLLINAAGGSINGDVDMGDGDDAVRIESAAGGATRPLTGVIDGGAGFDRLTFQGATGSWDAGGFTGFEELTKAGSGETILTGAWTDSGLQGGSVESGTLRLAADAQFRPAMVVRETGRYAVDGTQLGNVTVDQGGFLSGTGTIGRADAPAELLGNGTVSPGNSIGTLTIQGDYIQGAGGILEIELGPDGAADLLQVSGTAQLDGAVQFIPLDAGVLGDYTFLIAGGGVSGQFSAMNPDAERAREGLFFTYALDYAQGDRVSVTVSRTGTNPDWPGDDEPPVEPDDPLEPEEPVEPQQPAEPTMWDVISNLSPNQTEVRESFLADGAFSEDLAEVRASLNGIAPSRAAAALDSYSGEIYAVTPFVAAKAGERFASALARRTAGERSGERHGRREVRTGSAEHGALFWMEALGLAGDQDSRTHGHGYDFDTAGLAIGADWGLGANARIGIAGGYSATDVDQDAVGSSAELRSIHAGAYASLSSGRLSVDGQLTYARHRMDVSRRIVTGNTSSRIAQGEMDADELRASVTAGYLLSDDGVAVRPYGGLSYVHVDQGGLRERGAGDAGLIIDDGGFEALTGTIGVDARWTLGAVRPFIDLAVSHDLHRDGWRIDTKMIGGGTRMPIVGARAGRTAGTANLGLAATIGTVEAHAGYRLELREGYTAHAATAGLGIRW